MINPDFRDLFAEFAAREVRFLIVGGYAVAFHGHPRQTKDVDVWIAADPENAARALAALIAFGAPGADLSIDDLTDPDNVFQIGVAPNRIDILTALTGIEFEAAWPDRLPARYGDVEVAYLGLDALLEAKRASGRPQDLLPTAAAWRHEDGPAGRSPDSASRTCGAPNQPWILLV